MTYFSSAKAPRKVYLKKNLKIVFPSLLKVHHPSLSINGTMFIFTFFQSDNLSWGKWLHAVLWWPWHPFTWLQIYVRRGTYVYDIHSHVKFKKQLTIDDKLFFKSNFDDKSTLAKISHFKYEISLTQKIFSEKVFDYKREFFVKCNVTFTKIIWRNLHFCETYLFDEKKSIDWENIHLSILVDA